MIKLLLLVFHIPFFYICALFQSLWGLWFFCAELIIALFLWLSTWTFQKRTHLSIKESMVVVHKNECVSNPFYVKKGSLQPGKIRLFCTLKNPYSSTSLRFNLQDSLLFTAKDCGFFELNLHKIWIYDWLGLFHRKSTKENTTIPIVILPDPVPIFLEMKQAPQGSQDLKIETRIGQVGEPSFEIKNIREYQEQDPLHHIHWKLSSRTDTIWVKDYEKEQAKTPLIQACFTPQDELEDARFYQKVYSILLGFLIQKQPVILWWNQDQNDTAYRIDHQRELDHTFANLLAHQEPSPMALPGEPPDLVISSQ